LECFDVHLFMLFIFRSVINLKTLKYHKVVQAIQLVQIMLLCILKFDKLFFLYSGKVLLFIVDIF